MERAVTLAKVLGIDEVDKGLGAAAVHQRFTHEDLISIVNTGGGANPTTGTTHTVTDQGQWLSQGTGGWANFGTAPAATTDEDLEGATMNASTMTPALSDAAIENLIVLMHTTRMPHARAVVADVLATAKAQRWDPTEVVRVLLEAEATGRNASMLAIRHKRAGFPTGKTFEVWDEALSSLPAATTSFLQTLEWGAAA